MAVSHLKVNVIMGVKVIGLLLLLFAGVCQGSFGIGYKRYHPFAWEVFWALYTGFCFIMSLIWTTIKVPDWYNYIGITGSGPFITAILCGVVWGISAIYFTKSIDIIGMSLVYGISMGVSTIAGSLLPLIINKNLPTGNSAFYLAVGLFISLIGIGVITLAGMKRDGNEEKSNTKKGIIFAVVSGLGSGAMNLGFNATAPIGDAVKYAGYDRTGASALGWMLVIFGGLLITEVYCIYRMLKNKSYKTIREKGAGSRSLKLFNTSIVWFMALLLYGIATYMLGDFGSVIGWILFNALALMISSGWGLILGEWKSSGEARKLLFIGNAILVGAWFFIANV